MRSLIILEVEHGETTDGLQMFTERINREALREVWDDISIVDYTFKIDIPDCFVLDTHTQG